MVTLGEVEDLAQETRWLQAHNHSGLPADGGSQPSFQGGEAEGGECIRLLGGKEAARREEPLTYRVKRNENAWDMDKPGSPHEGLAFQPRMLLENAHVALPSELERLALSSPRGQGKHTGQVTSHPFGSSHISSLLFTRAK